MTERRPEVILTTTASVDGRISLGATHRLLDPGVSARWSAMAVPEAWPNRHERLRSTATLEGSGSFVDAGAQAPSWPEPGDADGLHENHLPRRAARWFVVADGRGRVDWQFTGDDETALLVLVCRATPAGYLRRLQDLGVGYLVVGAAPILSQVADASSWSTPVVPPARPNWA